MSLRPLLLGLALGACALAACGGEEAGVPEMRPSADKPSLLTAWRGRNLDGWIERSRSAVAAERADAAWALGEIGSGDPEAAAALASLLEDPDPDVRAAALSVSSRAGVTPSAAALERAVRDLGSPAGGLRRAARAAVLASGEAAVPLLEAALGAEETAARWGALRALASLDGLPATLVPRVVRLATEDPAPEVRRAAVLVLPRLGPEGLEATLAEFRSSDFRRSEVAAAALAEAGGRSVPALVPLLADPDEVLAARAASVLADVGQAAEPAVPALLAALRRVGQVRFNAADALVAIGRPSVPGLEALAADPDASLAALAADALRRIR